MSDREWEKILQIMYMKIPDTIFSIFTMPRAFSLQKF